MPNGGVRPRNEIRAPGVEEPDEGPVKIALVLALFACFVTNVARRGQQPERAVPPSGARTRRA